MMITAHTRTGQRRTLPIAVMVALLIGLVLSTVLGRLNVPVRLGPIVTPPQVSLPSASVAFAPNMGQAPANVLFTAHSQEGALSFGPSEVTLSIQMGTATNPASIGQTAQSEVSVRFLDAAPAVVSEANPLPGKVNYLLGNDPAMWQRNIPTYSGIQYSGLYPGVELAYQGVDRNLKGTYIVAPGADWTRIRWSYAGAKSVTKDGSGNLQIALSQSSGQGSLTELAPTAWQEIDGKRTTVSARYVVAQDGSVGFALGNYNPMYSLTIDPTLTFSTYIGGSQEDDGMGIAVDSSGNIYVTGITASTNFPTVNPYQPSNLGEPDAFVTKFNSDGTVAYSTYLGGNGGDDGYGIKAAPSGEVFITGETTSSDFPTRNAYMSSSGGNVDAFLTELNAAGSDLVYSTYYGGSGSEIGRGISVQGTLAYISGETTSTNMPTRNAYQATFGGSTDAYLAKFDTAASGDASFLYATYMGGSADDYSGGRGLTDIGHGVASDAAGNAYLTGLTNSTNFPVRNAYQNSFAGGGNSDAWAARINTTLSGDPSLVYSTYLGGTGGEAGRDVGVDGAGNVYVVGNSSSPAFPIRSGYANCSGNLGPFVAKFNMGGSGNSSLLYSTCFGANGTGLSSGIYVDSAGHAFITGKTSSATFPQLQGLQAFGGVQDAFVLELNTAGNGLVFSTFLGGSGLDAGYDIVVDSNNYSYVVGFTSSTNFPVVNPQYPNAGNGDAFVSRINNAPQATITPIPTNTGTVTPTPTNTRTPLPTQPGATATPTRRPTYTPAPTFTAGPTNTATFTPAAGTPTPLPCTINFSDVHSTDYFYAAVQYLYCHGAISGYSNGTFRPYNNTTRSQLVKIVVIAENWVIIDPANPTFTDVPRDNTFYTYIETAVQRQVISGYGDGTFRPYNYVTRGQVCKIIAIAQRWVIIDPVYPRFSDVGVDNPFYVFIETTASHNVISGYADGTFRWRNNATRGQLSKIIYISITQP